MNLNQPQIKIFTAKEFPKNATNNQFQTSVTVQKVKEYTKNGEEIISLIELDFTLDGTDYTLYNQLSFTKSRIGQALYIDFLKQSKLIEKCDMNAHNPSTDLEGGAFIVTIEKVKNAKYDKTDSKSNPYYIKIVGFAPLN